MTLDDYRQALRPKVQGSLNLHNLLASSSLDFFLLLSSCSGIYGASGQGNYASACTFQDAFARWRTSQGLRTRSLDLGMIESAGYVSENPDVFQYVTGLGFRPVKLTEFLALLDYAITRPVSGVDDSQLIVGLLATDGTSCPPGYLDAKFIHLRTQSQTSPSSPASRRNNNTELSSSSSLAARIKAATALAEIHAIITTAIVAQVSKVLVVPVDDINPSRKISSYGGDSLAAVELRNWFARSLDASVGVMEILSGKSIEALAVKVAERTKLASSFQAKGKAGEAEG